MKRQDIIALRLQNQQLLLPSFTAAADVVRWLGAVQSQDYAGAKWALANRLKTPVEADIEAAINAGHILRTHVLRPTWHFVLPEDIRWMIELTEPRISALSAKYFRDLALDKTVLNKSNKTIVKALQSGRHLTRKELGEALENARIATNDLRLTYIIFRAELDQLICNGARRGKQFTYALLDERAISATRFQRDEALAELSQRYFRSRGPATVKDFVWWSGLSSTDASKGLEMVKSQLECVTFGDQSYFFSQPAEGKKKHSVHLLPAYDEYTVAYKDRSLVIDRAFEEHAGHGIFNPNIIVNGQVIGSWRREISGNKVMMEVQYFSRVAANTGKKVSSAAKRYANFIAKELTIKNI
ncbi:MAG TPA: winged helix DNA-binding domain-containing protein [Chryseolinea sp.]